MKPDLENLKRKIRERVRSVKPKLDSLREDLQIRIAKSRTFKVFARRWSAFAALAWIAVVGALAYAEVGEFIDANVTRPFFFRVREKLVKDPELDPKLKILSYDDGSVDKLQRPDLTIDDWATVLVAIGERKPRMILIDKVFGIIFDPLGRREEAIKALAAMQVPVIVGAFATEREIKTRTRLDLDKDQYRPKGAVNVPDNTYLGWNVYGPNPALAAAFRGAGSLLYFDNGVVNAFIHPKPDVVVPHIAIFAGEQRAFENGRLVVDGVKLPTNGRGQILVNFSKVDRYYDRHKRLGTAVLNAREGKPIEYVAEGDTVLILPEMFTGSTDFKFTPIGLVPGGFVLASMINSILTGKWLVPFQGTEVLIFGLGLLGFIWGHMTMGGRFWAGQLAVTATMFLSSVYLFSYHSIVVSGLLPTVSAWGAALLGFAHQTREREREAARVRDELNDAAEIAKAFRPDDAPTWEGITISSFHRSFTEASGDWYAFRESPSGRFKHFVLCDITGHGVQAALVVSICKTMLVIMGKTMLTAMSTDANRLESREFLAGYAADLNGMLHIHGKGQHLVTMLGFTFDTQEKELIYCSAGHPSPVYATADPAGGRKFSLMAMRSTVLGLSDEVILKTVVKKLKPGDEIVAYTDGLPINRHVRLVTQFFKEEKYDLSKAPKTLLDAIWGNEYLKSGKTIDDDVSIVWFKAA